MITVNQVSKSFGTRTLFDSVSVTCYTGTMNGPPWNNRRTCVFLITAALLLGALPALAGDFLIVPGRRIGSVQIGMSQEAVHQALRAPSLTRRLAGGVSEESWVTPLPRARRRAYRNDGRYWKAYFVNIYFRGGRVAQVEVNAPLFRTPGGLSADAPTIKFERAYRPYRSSDRGGYPLRYGTRDTAGGFPGTKHYVTMEDAVRAGIAWRYGAWGDLAPDPDPDAQEVLLVHAPGRRAVLEPDAGNRFVLSSRDPGYDTD